MADGFVEGDGSSLYPVASADGQVVAFQSWAANFDPADTGHDLDIYIRDQSTDELTLASVTKGGTKGNFGSTDPAISVAAAALRNCPAIEDTSTSDD